jgi:hypothetical protein
MIITSPITEGPSKFDLMASLFDGKIVQFTQQNNQHPKIIKVILLSVEREDGSNESWNLRVLVKGSEFPLQIGKNLSMYYNSRTRKGTLRLS